MKAMADNNAPAIAPEERREPADAVDSKADALVDLIKKSKHFIAFTGAGVSTSAGQWFIMTFNGYLLTKSRYSGLSRT